MTEEEATTGPITADGDMPQKKFYRQRAHCNPLAHNDSFQYPHTVEDTSWLAQHYPHNRRPTVLDCGCGFGGLTVALAKALPEEVIMGMEIRAKVTEYVRLRIAALRSESSTGSSCYDNASVMRTNSMKFLPNFFPRGSIQKLFFCFPDPHFKRKNHGRRIVSERLLTEYAFLLVPGQGRLYCITDVQELHQWHVQKCNAHPLFRRLKEEEIKDDPCVELMKNETEEGKKVTKLGGDNKKGEKYYCVYQRILDAEIPPVQADNFFAIEEDENESNNNNESQE
ncbi:tRNA (guanine-N(7)-)-methyltransferase [Seminavis robusta]|uniref:tRNA (guanine-N(7)-)-methyltransferase n=1 Tax=Seminavis robusta TaxID=568900 RepID=A0A9N8E6E1_9STRA|nr:tRNA (guanine-N(7)-)-methyltransferase [Seminavis robusta]|eukprot:Sro599_g173150.1 tRNA (guanine-N(7)-)-methyltransferase (282) ;mRNA; r:9471-10316